jgi:hypothetical protein
MLDLTSRSRTSGVSITEAKGFYIGLDAYWQLS